jgi:hypothetical protein
MLKMLAILAILALPANSGKKDQRSDLPKDDCENHAAPAVSFVNNETSYPQRQAAKDESPNWYASPEWWLFILGVPTLIFVGYQSRLMAKHAEHFENLAKAAADNATATKQALDLSRDTAKKQLRSYFGAPEGKLYIREDATVEPRITFTNCGQTPAYDFQVIESGRFETRPFKKIPRPPQDMMLPTHAHIVGGSQPYYFSCRIVAYGRGKQELLSDLSSADQAFILNGWCSYRDIFGDTHQVDFQLIIGGGTRLQRTVDQNGEWYGLFTDSEGNVAD